MACLALRTGIIRSSLACGNADATLTSRQVRSRQVKILRAAGWVSGRSACDVLLDRLFLPAACFISILLL